MEVVNEESEAMQIGRDDFKWYDVNGPCVVLCPFPKGSVDAEEWRKGFNLQKEQQ